MRRRRRWNGFRSDGDYRFTFELAEKLTMTRAQLIRSMSAYELMEWRALYRLRHEEAAIRAAEAEAKANRGRG